MFEVVKTFVHETGFEITPFYMQGTGFVFLPKELETQLGYEDLAHTMAQSDSFKEGIEYVILRDSNLLEFKELLRSINSIDQPCKTGDESIKYSPSLLLLTESGLYTAMILSRKPNAENFRRWITCEILPSIRKKGFYLHPSQGDMELSTQHHVPLYIGDIQALTLLPKVVDKLKAQIQEFRQENYERLDQIEAVLSECYRQHDIFGGWKKIKMLVDDMTEIYDLTEEERRKYFSVLCQEHDICLPEKAILEREEEYYDVKTMAQRLGIYSTNGKPHVLLITAIIAHLKLDKYQKSAYGVAKYSEKAISAVSQWLKEQGFPQKLQLAWGKTKRQFELKYLRKK